MTLYQKNVSIETLKKIMASYYLKDEKSRSAQTVLKKFQINNLNFVVEFQKQA